MVVSGSRLEMRDAGEAKYLGDWGLSIYLNKALHF